MQTKELLALAREGASVRVERLQAEIKYLTQTFGAGLTAVNNITGVEKTVHAGGAAKGPMTERRHWTQTPEGRAKMALAQKKRWKQIKKSQNGATAK